MAEINIPESFIMNQLEEIYAIHYIYYPVHVISTGGVNIDKFPNDCLLDVQKLRFKTSIKCNESTLKGHRRSELIRYSFKLVPFDDGKDDVFYAIVDVTYPKNYPKVTPFINLGLTIDLSIDGIKNFEGKLNEIITKSQGNICIFDVGVCITELMNDLIQNKHDNLWQEMTIRNELEGKSIGSTAIPSSTDNYVFYHTDVGKDRTRGDEPYSVSNRLDLRGGRENARRQNDTLADSSSFYFVETSGYRSGGDKDCVRSPSNMDLRDQYEKEGLTDLQMELADISLWSVHSLVQTPLWYEKRNRLNTQVDEYNKSSANGILPSSLMNMPTYETSQVKYIKSEPIVDLPAKDDDFYSENVDLDSILGSKEIIKEYLIRIYNIKDRLKENKRFDHVFNESELIDANDSHKLVKAEHKLDQNLYIIRSFVIPPLCPFNELLKSAEGIKHFCFKKKLLTGKLIAKIASLAKLEHNSLARYYQCWLEKDATQLLTDFITLCKDIINNQDVNGSNPVLKQLILIALNHNSTLGKDVIHDLLITDIIIKNVIHIQMEHIHGHTLEEEIQKHDLYRDQKSIWTFMRRLLDVLAYLHQNNVYHQSLSSSNIIIHTDSYGRGLKVYQFGITKLLRQLAITKHNCRCCSPNSDIKKHIYQSHPSHYFIGDINVISDTSGHNTGRNAIESRLPPTSALKSPTELTGDPAMMNPSSDLDGHIKELNPSGKKEGSLNYSPDDLQQHLTPHFGSNVANMYSEDYDYQAEQEDMFAFGLLIFKMWHPPIDESRWHEFTSSIIHTRTFPPYFLQNTPATIVTTILRLLTDDRRPTAQELLNETLVPPVVDIYLYKQYLRRLQNPSSEESIDATKFLFNRGRKLDECRYFKVMHDVGKLSHTSFIVDTLENHMKKKAAIQTPLVLQPKTDSDASDRVLVLDRGNTLLHLTNNLRRDLQRRNECTHADLSLGVRYFSMGEVYTTEGCKISSVYGMMVRLENALMDINVKNKRGCIDYKLFDDISVKILSAEGDLVVNAIDSLLEFGISDDVVIVITYPPLVVDFISLVFSVSVEVANNIYSRLAMMDINEYMFNKLLDENGIDKSLYNGYIKGIVDILSSKYDLLTSLYKLHSLVMKIVRPSTGFLEFVSVMERLIMLGGFEPCVFNEVNVVSGNICECYLKKVIHMLMFTRFIKALDYERFCVLELCSSVDVLELYDASIDYLSFLGYLNRHLVVIGGCYESNDDTVVNFVSEYFIDDLITLSMKRDQVSKEDDEDSNLKIKSCLTVNNNVDVVITCQTIKLLPAAASIANKLIDAGITCECRAVPLILTNHFNGRLQTIKNVRAVVHLLKVSNALVPTLPYGVPDDKSLGLKSGTMLPASMDTSVPSADTPGDHGRGKYGFAYDTSAREVHETRSAETRSNKRDFAAREGEWDAAGDSEEELDDEDDLEKMQLNILYHVEPINGSFTQAKKIDNESSLVHFLIGQLS